MATENFKEAGEIFQNIIEIEDQAKREQYLENACQGDDKLRADVEALLKAHEEAGDYLEAPAVGANVTLDGLAQIEGPGTKIGRYELLELIGEGGMGLVYLAEQKEPERRKVVLKVIKPGMDSKQVIARFEAERQALAVLDHPNIAHVFDAGATAAGMPYFVMEYVKGMSITRYCDEHKLNIEQRLRLFEQVCEGVHHAHQKGIIHRDLKPSNILVSVHGDRAVPKIIDFGIAKAVTQPLTDKTFVTLQGQLLGTPEYMSPEQVDFATQDIDTRSDIYSLGVVLYELLAGVLPFEEESFVRAGLAEIQQTIREQEPASPSIRLTNLGEKAKTIAASRGTQVIPLARRLHRELEWIPLKAMRKDRCRRYRSATEMADDIRNYLTGLPLLAGPETTIYRLQKFVHKHAGSVATAALVASAIVLGFVVSTVMYLRAESMRVQAEQAREQEASARMEAEAARERAEQAEEVTQQKAEDLRRSLYANTVQVAGAKYSEGNISRVRELLNACPNDLRGWEWNRLSHVTDQSSVTLRGHNSIIRSLALSPDGRRIVSSGNDATTRIWDAETGAQLLKLQGPGGDSLCVTYSPDGTRIASGGRDGKVRVLDALTGKELVSLTGRADEAFSLSFDPDGKHIVSGGSDGIIKVWDVETGLEVNTIIGYEEYIRSVAFSPDGRKIISAAADRQVKVWDAATGAKVMTLEGAAQAFFSPDGRYIAGMGNDDVKLWDASTGEQVAILGSRSGQIRALTFTGDGRHVVFGGWTCAIRIWDMATKSEVRILRGHESPVDPIVSARDGKRLVSGSWDGTIKVWDLTWDRGRVTLRGHIDRGNVLAGVSSDGRRVAAHAFWGSTIWIYDVTTGVEVATLRKPGAKIHAAFLSMDGRCIVSGNSDGTIDVWDVETAANVRTMRRHERDVLAVALTPDTKRVISGGMDKTIKISDTESGAELTTLRGHAAGIRSLACSADGTHVVSGAMDGILKVWDITLGTEVATLRGHSKAVISVSFSPDGKRIVSASFDGVLKVWDATTFVELTTLRGHNGLVQSAAYSPDGKRIVSGGADHTVRVWDAGTGIELLTMGEYEEPIWSTVFTPDGKSLVVAGPGVTLLESAVPPGGYGPRRAAEAARKVVDDLHQKQGYYYKVIEQLGIDTTLDEPIRRLALEIANTRRTEDAEKLVDELYKKHGSYPEVIENLQVNRSLDESTRRVAIQIADSRKAGSMETLIRRIGKEVMKVIGSPRDDDPNANRAALERAEKAVRLDPNNVSMLIALGMAQQSAGQLEDATRTLSRAHDLEPNMPAILGPLSEIQYHIGRYEDAVKSLANEVEIDRREFGEQNPMTLYAMNQLAWMQATCPAAEVRNGAQAVKLATRACELTEWREPMHVDTLAAAYSETGDFDSAIKWQKKAINLLTKKEPAEWPGQFDDRLKLYQSGKPYRERLSHP